MKKEILIPDLGNITSAEVIEIPVQVGMVIQKESPIVILEGEKATIEVPAPFAGTVESILCQVGQKVSSGAVVCTLIVEALVESLEPKVPIILPEEPELSQEMIVFPNLGTSAASVIDILVSQGMLVTEGEPLLVLESEKASMEVPAPYSGKVLELKVQVGDKVESGFDLLLLETKRRPRLEGSGLSPSGMGVSLPTAPIQKIPESMSVSQSDTYFSAEVHAGPSVRRVAREFGVNLTAVRGSGRKGRILLEDVQSYVKLRLQSKEASTFDLPPAPQYDFAKYGPIEPLELSKIKQYTAVHVYRSWITVPQVTHFEESDITALEALRQKQKAQADQEGVKLTPLAYILKAVVQCLQEFPTFNASLDSKKTTLILKQYFHVGLAVDTPKGLVVPVIRHVDQKTVFQLAQEMAVMSQKARDNRLSPEDMEGSSFTISSLGGIGGVGFTPIVNLPNVAILGVSRSRMQPVYVKDAFVPRLILPFSLSYDHRVIDGAEAARFCKRLSEALSQADHLI